MVGIYYSCRKCGLHKVSVMVRYRFANEGVIHWVRDVVGKAIYDDHKKLSPKCRATSAQDVMLPAPTEEDQGIGHPPKAKPPTTEQNDSN